MQLFQDSRKTNTKTNEETLDEVKKFSYLDVIINRDGIDQEG